MPSRIKILSISLIAAFTLVTVGCGTDGGDDDATGDTTVTTIATDDSAVDEPTDPTTTPDEESDPFVPSGDGDSGPYVDAMKTSMRSANEGDVAVFTDAQIDCVAPRFVELIGVDRMRENGIEPADISSDDSMDFSNVGLSEDEGNALYDTFGECDIDLRETMLDSMAADEEMTPEMTACMEGVLTDENLRTFMVSSMVDGEAGEDDPEMAPLMGQLMGCAFMGMEEAMDSEPAN